MFRTVDDSSMSPAHDPHERHQISRIGALPRHAHTAGRDATAACEAFPFEKFANAERLRPVIERSRRAIAARKAYFVQLALDCARTRAIAAGDAAIPERNSD